MNQNFLLKFYWLVSVVEIQKISNHHFFEPEKYRKMKGKDTEGILLNYSQWRKAFLVSKSFSVSTLFSSGTQHSTGHTAAH